MIPKFKAEILNGKLIFAEREQFTEHITTLKDGDYYVLIDRESNKRSDAQNRYLWGVLYQIPADSLGWDVEDMHEFCKKEFNPIHKKIRDKEVIVPGSTTALTIAGFMEYKDKIQRFFAEQDIYIPDPNEVKIETETT